MTNPTTPADPLRAALRLLEKIADWQLPPSGQFAIDGHEFSFGYCYGSNGERDHMRQAARDAAGFVRAALAAPQAEPAAAHPLSDIRCARCDKPAVTTVLASVSHYPSCPCGSTQFNVVQLAPQPVAAVPAPAEPTQQHREAVDHAHEILRRLGYHRDEDFFINVNRVGAEAMHITTIGAIVNAALIAAAPKAPAVPAPDGPPIASWDEYSQQEARRLGGLPAMPAAQWGAVLHCALIAAMRFATSPEAPQAVPAGGEPVVSVAALSRMFEDLSGVDRQQPGYEWRKGWNDALRCAMDYAAPPQVPAGGEPPPLPPLPTPAAFWRTDIPGRAGPLMAPFFSAAQMGEYATAYMAQLTDYSVALNDRCIADAAEIGRLNAKLTAAPPQVLQPLTFDFTAHLRRQAEFSARTFGPGKRVEGVTDHIAKELAEVRESDGSLAEWIDVVILALDGCWRSGASPEQIIAAMVAKQTKNEGRRWPDWRTAAPGKAIEHDRSQDGITGAEG